MTSHQGQNEKSRRGAQGPPVHQIWCNSDHYFRSYGILEKMAHAIFFRSAAILKVLVGPNWFLNLSEPWVKESRHANFGAIQAIFLQLSWSQHKLAHSCQGRGQRSNGAINRNKHLFRSFCRGISNLVTSSLTVAELFQKEGMKWQRERERERAVRNRVENKTYPPPRGYVITQAWICLFYFGNSYIFEGWHSVLWLITDSSCWFWK